MNVIHLLQVMLVTPLASGKQSSKQKICLNGWQSICAMLLERLVSVKLNPPKTNIVLNGRNDEMVINHCCRRLFCTFLYLIVPFVYFVSFISPFFPFLSLHTLSLLFQAIPCQIVDVNQDAFSVIISNISQQWIPAICTVVRPFGPLNFLHRAFVTLTIQIIMKITIEPIVLMNNQD